MTAKLVQDHFFAHTLQSQPRSAAVYSAEKPAIHLHQSISQPSQNKSQSHLKKPLHTQSTSKIAVHSTDAAGPANYTPQKHHGELKQTMQLPNPNYSAYHGHPEGEADSSKRPSQVRRLPSGAVVNGPHSQNIYHMVLQHGSKGINQLVRMSGNQPYAVQRLDLAHHGSEARSQKGTAKAGALFLGTSGDQAGLTQGYLERKKAQHIHTHCLNGVASQSMTYSQYNATAVELGHPGPRSLAQAGYSESEKRATRHP